MIKLVISNQRGGVAKTTTTHSLARVFADQGLRVLMVDTDPQGSLTLLLGLKPKLYLKDFVVDGHAFEECIVQAHKNIDVLCSNRETQKAELTLHNMTAGEFAFIRLFGMVDKPYDVVLIDSAPSINLIQTCAMVYTKHVLIPVAMDMLSLQGAAACIETMKMLSEVMSIPVKPIALLPTMVDRRFNLTNFTLSALQEFGDKTGVPLLPAIRTDGAVSKSGRTRQFLADFDPRGKALEDYHAAAVALTDLIYGERKQEAVPA